MPDARRPLLSDPLSFTHDPLLESSETCALAVEVLTPVLFSQRQCCAGGVTPTGATSCRTGAATLLAGLCPADRHMIPSSI